MTRKVVLTAILVIGLGAALFIAAQRARVESRNRAVELVVDYNEIAQITAATGKSPVEVLRSLKQSGVTSVAVSEQTVRDLIESRQVQWPWGDASSPDGTTLEPRVLGHLQAILGETT